MIDITATGNIAKFIIEDHGVGISGGEQKNLFHRFKCLDQANNHQKGLGVGLYITQQIIHAHKGTIKLKSRLNHESKFIVELPMK